MPIYEYRCEKGHTFEVIQGFDDEPVSECQTCSRPVTKVFHPVAVHFKGKGFYNTDYGTRKRARENKEFKESSKDSGESKSSSGTDSGSSSKDSSSSSSSDSNGKVKAAAASSSSSSSTTKKSSKD
jgi:putative FmdB family regulatory protein